MCPNWCCGYPTWFLDISRALWGLASGGFIEDERGEFEITTKPKGEVKMKKEGERKMMKMDRMMGCKCLKVTTLWLAVALVMVGSLLAENAFAASAKGAVLEFKFAEVVPAASIYGRYEAKFGKLIEERSGVRWKLPTSPEGSWVAKR